MRKLRPRKINGVPSHISGHQQDKDSNSALTPQIMLFMPCHLIAHFTSGMINFASLQPCSNASFSKCLLQTMSQINLREVNNDKTQISQALRKENSKLHVFFLNTVRCSSLELEGGSHTVGRTVNGIAILENNLALYNKIRGMGPTHSYSTQAHIYHTKPSVFVYYRVSVQERP